MKSVNYRFGHNTFKAHFTQVGHGWEVSCTFNKKTVFVGNFIHKVEATKWWVTMNKEIRKFTNTYWATETGVNGWYGNFFSTHLYKVYYKYLDTMFAKYNKTYAHAFTKSVKKYNKVKRNWNRADRCALKVA